MAISVVQSAQNAVDSTTSGNVLNVTLTNTPAVGNLLVTFGGTDVSNATVQSGMTLIDNSTTNWEVLDQYRVVQTGDGKSWPCISTSGTTNQTVSGVVYEIAGAASSGFINAHNQSNSTSSGTSSPNTMTTATITPTVNGCLIIACAFYGLVGGATTPGAVTVNGSFAVDQKVNNVSTSATFGALMATASFVQATAAPVSCTFTNNNAVEFTANDTFILAIAPSVSSSNGSLSETLGALTSSASGQVEATAGAAIALGPATLASTAQVIDAASFGIALGATALTATGTTTNASTGTLNEVLGSLSLTGAAESIGTATLSEAFGAMQCSAQGSVIGSASLGVSLNAVTLQSAGGMVVSGPQITVPLNLQPSWTLETPLSTSVSLPLSLNPTIAVQFYLE